MLKIIQPESEQKQVQFNTEIQQLGAHTSTSTLPFLLELHNKNGPMSLVNLNDCPRPALQLSTSAEAGLGCTGLEEHYVNSIRL